MSRRSILQTTSKLFTITATRHAPHCPLPLASYSRTEISRGHVRTKYHAAVSAPGSKKKYGRRYRNEGARIRMTYECNTELKKLGLEFQESENLLGAIHSRSVEKRGVRFVYDCVRNRKLYLDNPSKIPPAYTRLWEVALLEDEALGCDIAGIGDHSDSVIGKACHILGLDFLNKAEITRKSGHMSFGCFLLEISVLFGVPDAAAHLINYHNSPINAITLADADLQTSTRDAETLVRTLATKAPFEGTPNVMLVYLRAEFGLRRISLQTPGQLQWGFTKSESVIVPATDYLIKTEPYDVYTHPAQIRLDILEHCMKKNMSLPKIPLEEMPSWRDSALLELAGINDPRASLILAVNENGPALYSDGFEKLLMAAAAGGIPQACRLLSIHFLHKEGVLPVGPETKEKLPDSRGIELGRICILSYLEDPTSFVGITAAYAAICRAADNYSLGLSILEEALTLAKEEPKFPIKSINQLEDEHIKDYKLRDPNRTGYWNQEKTATFFPAFDTASVVKTVRLAYH